MVALYIVIVIVIGVVCSIGLLCYFEYKPKQLAYKKEQEAMMTEVTLKSLLLDIEKENTKQIQLDKDAFEAKEKTRQYEIKSAYKDKHDSTLY